MNVLEVFPEGLFLYIDAQRCCLDTCSRKCCRWCLLQKVLYMVFIAESAVHGGEGMYENSLFNNEEYSGKHTYEV